MVSHFTEIHLVNLLVHLVEGGHALAEDGTDLRVGLGTIVACGVRIRVFAGGVCVGGGGITDIGTIGLFGA